MTTTQPTDLLELDAAAQDLLFREARTANTFTDEPVADEQIQAIYDLIKWGPTSMNQQPLRAVVLRSPEARARLVQHMADGNKDKTTKAPLTVVLFADNNFHEHLPTLFPHMEGAKDFFADDAYREHSAKLNAALQIAYFIVGIRAAGLAAGPMNGFDHAAVEKEFFPEGGHHALVAINIGKPGPDAWFPRSPRFEAKDVITTL
ncbi:malonic semialdehyde reductase [Nocardia cyriacigeorgica]|uniref:malonic semialdehyde reductase n=1 Tax=Nocardia cyriacigeorgica TaxID=135487 RepID=UPI001893466F|nr:malonic semialdehyde reductase [Nocardia cyriacigeorgica]MBF6412018.1 malonic semialdehyde reductase [Nocardia cyriacigeorgica]